MKAVISFPELLPDIQLKKMKSVVFRDQINPRHLNVQVKAPSPELGGLVPNITTSDTRAPYIFLPIFVITMNQRRHEFDAILDTGAPLTEFPTERLNIQDFQTRRKCRFKRRAANTEVWKNYSFSNSNPQS